MHVNVYRLVERNFPSKAAFVKAARRNMLSIAQDGATGHGGAVLGVWLDGDRQGVSMRVLRDHELGLGQSMAWRPLRAFGLHRVPLEGVDWLARELTGDSQHAV